MHGRSIRPPDGERLGLMAGCAQSESDRRRRITFGKQHGVVRVEAGVVDSQSNAVTTPFDMIWEKLSKSLVFGSLVGQPIRLLKVP